MKVSLLLAAAAALLASAGNTSAEARNVSAPSPTAPVARVVELLGQLQARIGQDGQSEQAAYDKFACWCEEATAKKADEITQLRTSIGELGQAILRLKGSVAVASSELKELARQMAETEKAKETATAIRHKENEAFVVEKVELQQAVAALEKAIMVLKAASSTASLRQSRAQTSVSTALSAVQSAVQQLPPHSKPNATHLLALSRVSGKGGYTPQSATVQGILSDMYHSFVTTLEQRTSEEATAHRNFEDLLATYNKELATMQETVEKKRKAKTEAELMLAEAEQEYDDSTQQMQAEVLYFDATKASCQEKTDEWAARKALRAEELRGIQEALDILTSEEAKELFSKADQSGAQSFLQIAAANGETPAKKAAQTLQAHAKKAQSIRLASLAADLREVEAAAREGAVGHFGEVITAIDSLIQVLRQEEVTDQSQVDSCKDQYHQINVKLGELNWKVANNEAQIKKLGQLITQKTEDRDAVIDSIAELDADIKAMEGNRTEENTQFLGGKSDDLKAIQLLEQARGALQKYYSNHTIEMGPLQSLLQGSRNALASGNATEWDKPEAKFSGKGNQKIAAKGIVALLTNIIEDLQSGLVASSKAEEAAQLDYEKRKAAGEKTLEELKASKIRLDQAITARETEKGEEQEALGDNNVDIGTQNQTRKDLQPNCDFMINNIEERRRKRAEELEGLRLAKEYLAGASPVLLQKKSRRQRQEPRRWEGNGFLGISFKAVP